MWNSVKVEEWWTPNWNHYYVNENVNKMQASQLEIFLLWCATKSTKEAIEHYIKCDLIVVVKRKEKMWRNANHFWIWLKKKFKSVDRKENQINSIRYMKVRTMCVIPQKKRKKTETKSKPMRLGVISKVISTTTHTLSFAMRSKGKQKHIP